MSEQRARINPKASAKQSRLHSGLRNRLSLSVANGREAQTQLAAQRRESGLQHIRRGSLRTRALGEVSGSDSQPTLSTDEMRMLGSKATAGMGVSREEVATAEQPISLAGYRAAKEAEIAAANGANGANGHISSQVPEVAPVPERIAAGQAAPAEQPQLPVEQPQPPMAAEGR